jgi:hypothetical protein
VSCRLPARKGEHRTRRLGRTHGSADDSRLPVGFTTSAAEQVASYTDDARVVEAYAGPRDAARLVEPSMMLMVRIAYAGLPRDVGSRLLERST